MSETPHAASFRDPAGRLAVFSDRVVRVVRPEGRDELQAFFDSETMKGAQADGRVVTTEELQGDAARQAADAVGWTPQDGGAVLSHAKIPFPSYPYEWPAEMLEAAGRLTLDLQDGLVGEGLGLKDATPYNVLFDGPKPVFIDVLSVERRDAHDPVWTPHAQFIRTFLLPLLVRKDLGVPLADTFLTHRDGLQPEDVFRMTPRLRRWRAPYLSLVTLPSRLAARADAQGEAVYEPKRLKNAEQARYVITSAVRRLRKRLAAIAPRGDEVSNWSEYMSSRGHYADEDAERKERFVQAALDEHCPDWVMDVGCNTGHFSRLAAKAGARVVAVDLDPVSVGRVWRGAQAEGLDILPLVVNLSRPTPAVGWRNAECPSFLDRAEGRFDMVFMLAVMHHLHVTERVPLEEIVDLAAHLSRRHVVFEYVGPQDPMFRHLLRGRGHLHEDLDRERFEAAVRTRFDILRAEPLAGADRVMYVLERKEDAAVATATDHAVAHGVTHHEVAVEAEAGA